MKEEFKSVMFRSESLKLIAKCNEVVDRYTKMGLRLTLRQLYYQLVSGNIILNMERSYKNLSNLVSDARLSGLLDWDAIEDRIRVPRFQSEFRDLSQLVDAALYSYRLPRWDGQSTYVELWVEKDALAGVLAPLAKKYHVTMMVNRGYSSQTAMYEASKRYLGHDDIPEQIIFYLGDFDPSGEDMVRDIENRMLIFGCGSGFRIEKIALTLDQVRAYNPPPNPAKRKDPRAKEFMSKYGSSSWEVDALPPDVLSTIISRSIESVLDMDKMKIIMHQENEDKKELTKAVKNIIDGR